MDVEDRRRYFIVGSVILEIVQPLFRTRLENDYKRKGQGSLQAFLSTLPVLHILFHLRHRNAYCCKDNLNCRNNSKLPLIYCQWDLLYTEKPGQPGHDCHCKFIANPVQLNELDITLTSLILLNCCHLGISDENAVRKLRRYKNDYLSHNIEGKITETEYKSQWTDLTNFVLQLDPNKQDDLIRIEKRLLDEGLCNRYSIDLLNIHKKLNEMGTQIQEISSGMKVMGPQIEEINSGMQVMVTQMQGISSGMQVMGPQMHGISSGMQDMGPQIQEISSGTQEILSYHRNQATCQYCKNRLYVYEQGMDKRKINLYKLGQNIFYLHDQIYMPSIPDEHLIGMITDVVMTDDGRLVMCLCSMNILLIYTINEPEVVTMPVNSGAYCLTSINNSTVAITVSQPSYCQRIEIYDIDNKQRLKSIPIPGGKVCHWDITKMNDKLAVTTDKGFVIMDYLSGEIVQNVETHFQPWGLHSSDSRIFYTDSNRSENNLHVYCFTKDKIHTLTLPSIPWSITTLKDGSLYVLCTDGSVQHVSVDGKHFKTLKTYQSKCFGDCRQIHYNLKQKNMMTFNVSTGMVRIFHEV